jgi:branched-chain amino acid transport system ATP-binding protein
MTNMMSATSALQTTHLRRSFGAFKATDDVSLDIAAGARHALIGPNGAGKTTLINLITGVLRPDSGDVLLGGQRVTDVAPFARVKRGLARTFQINTLFPGLTAIESVALAVCERLGQGTGWWRPLSARRDALDEAARLLASLQLAADAHTATRALPYGKQRLLEIALALATRPRVLLLDEPAAGVPSGESHQLLETIQALPPEMTILLIEHDMSLVFRFAQRITVLVDGRVLTEGSPSEVAADPRVREVYLGESNGEDQPHD